MKQTRYDPLLNDIANYIESYTLKKPESIQSAYLSFIDAIGCAFLALNYPACHNTLGPISQVQNTNGIPVFGSSHKLDPVMAAFNMSSMIRWLDFNDTWLGEEWGHPSDCLGGLLSCCYYANTFLNKSYTIQDVLEAMVKSYEIQGLLAQKNAFNRVGIDHVAFLKMGLTGVCTQLLGGTSDQILASLSLAIVDGHAMRTYRHQPNTGRRKSWAAADAVKDAVFLAFLAHRGEMGYPTCLSAPKWGLYDVYFKGKSFELHRDFDDFVINNILFKVPYSAEYHSITAIECAITLHQHYKNKLDDIEKIEIQSTDAAMRIIVKEGPLTNPASRDHCLQYIIAIGLIYGEVYPHHFEDTIAKNPLVDILRSKMTVSENKHFSQDYLDLSKKSCANSIKLIFKDRSESKLIEVSYPLGHPKRRTEASPKIIEKFKKNMTESSSSLSKNQCDVLIKTCLNKNSLLNQNVDHFLKHAST